MIFQSRLLLYAAIIWTVIMFIGCSWPSAGLSDDLTTNDKWLHIGIFAGFGFLWRVAGRSTLWVIGAGVAYGYLIEVYQWLMPIINRSYDLLDALADAVGTLIGVGLALLVLTVVRMGNEKEKRQRQ